MIDPSTMRVYTALGWSDFALRPDGSMQVKNVQIVSGDFYAKLERERSLAGRAPLGDSHGAWQKQAEIPMSLLSSKIPRDAWEDTDAILRLAQDRDFSHFKARDGRIA